VRWPGIFHSRWLTCAIGYPSVVKVFTAGLAQCEVWVIVQEGLLASQATAAMC
jgi:hypothetical protein